MLNKYQLQRFHQKKGFCSRMSRFLNGNDSVYSWVIAAPFKWGICFLVCCSPQNSLLSSSLLGSLIHTTCPTCLGIWICDSWSIGVGYSWKNVCHDTKKLMNQQSRITVFVKKANYAKEKYKQKSKWKIWKKEITHTK